ncbi:hypothetical protein [Wenxinia marina]|uniref:Uncharacterized protein n=1 Tax=Wenxinia marina DSM 24838 TaxID=1123501 RepID=A0A0D0NRJ6_9RHOB|nr:hypothetical protein [Wenxinia marina]KIQ70855.1 hypothetical protein Wenmar_00229 [Wenxinia marina DSM 24838]
MKAAAALLGLALASGAAAQSLDLPGNAVRVSEEAADPGTAEIAIGPYAEGRLPSLTVDGRVARSVWRIASAGLTTAQIMARLGAQLGPAGFETVYACDTDACGGFDFRFALDVADPPDMHVDLSGLPLTSPRAGRRTTRCCRSSSRARRWQGSSRSPAPAARARRRWPRRRTMP